MRHSALVTTTTDHRRPPAIPVLLGSAQACAALGVDRSTLTRWVKSGRLQAVGQVGRHGGAYVFAEEAINAAAAERASFLLASMALTRAHLS